MLIFEARLENRLSFLHVRRTAQLTFPTREFVRVSIIDDA